MWLLSSHIPTAFELGAKAKEKDINPFTSNTNEWYSFNKGYNNMINNKYNMFYNTNNK